MASSGEQGCGKPHNWNAISCRPQQPACGRTKLFSAGCLTIYRWRLSSPRKTSTQSVMLHALPPSGGTCWMATVFKHMRQWASPKRSMKKYFSFHAGLRARCSMSIFPLLNSRGRIATLAKLFAISAWIYATLNFAHKAGIFFARVSRAGLQCYCRTGWRAGR